MSPITDLIINSGTPPAPSAPAGQGKNALCRSSRPPSTPRSPSATKFLLSSVALPAVVLLRALSSVTRRHRLWSETNQRRLAASTHREHASMWPSWSLSLSRLRIALTSPRRCASDLKPTPERWRSRWWRSGATWWSARTSAQRQQHEGNACHSARRTGGTTSAALPALPPAWLMRLQGTSANLSARDTVTIQSAALIVPRSVVMMQEQESKICPVKGIQTFQAALRRL